MEYRNTLDLKPFKVNELMYGEGTEEFLDAFSLDVGEKGILSPIHIAPDNEILGGHTRWKEAIKRGIKQVQVIVHPEATTFEKKLELVLSLNLARHKTNTELGQEGRARRDLYKRYYENGNNDYKNYLEKACKHTGISISTFKRMVVVTDKLIALRKEEKLEEMRELISIFDSNIKQAYELVSKGKEVGSQDTSDDNKKVNTTVPGNLGDDNKKVNNFKVMLYSSWLDKIEKPEVIEEQRALDKIIEKINAVSNLDLHQTEDFDVENLF